MKAIRGKFRWASSIAVVLFVTSSATAAVVINEVVKEQRTATSGAVSPDDGEYVELFNNGNTAVDLTNWSITVYDLAGGAYSSAYTITSGSIAPGGYFVIGDSGVANVNFTPAGAPTELFADLVPNLIELRNAPNQFSGTIQDAVAYEVYRTGATRLTLTTPDQLAQIGNGFQGELLSINATAPNVPASWSRYTDGVDTNKNGLDFGIMPKTPGAANRTTPIASSHVVTDVDALTAGATLNNYHASFLLPRVITPGTTSSFHTKSIPASPQGGKAIVAWDESGGGNVAYSKELVNSFHLYAYLDTTPIALVGATADEEWQTTIYGIGSSDPFFRNPDPNLGIDTAPLPPAEPVTRNSSTGVGWMFQQYKDDRTNPDPAFTKLQLIDFGDGGDSEVPGEWTILETINLASTPANWFELGITYNPSNHQVTGIFNGQQFVHTISYDLFGTFFVGYREALTGAPSAAFADHHPPIYDLFAASLAGDFNGDGKVDGADYVRLRKQHGDISSGAGLTDYNTWRANFGKPPGSGSDGGGLGSGAVPEPSSALLALVGMLMAGAWGRRR